MGQLQKNNGIDKVMEVVKRAAQHEEDIGAVPKRKAFGGKMKGDPSDCD